ncbi:recombinase family protein [Klebsiella aerogenes]|uniref:recombinase family protein n=2 Tax=Klebsiella/Raoultella group TaxID=2890311 RepID=UPI001CE1B9CE|nr:recombinase family protein [Klebsiella aerogenes]MCA5546995.1 recombinase family protein [Klebsiella pneumoniae]
MPVAAGLGAHQPNRRLRLAAEPQTGRREVSALTDARKTLAYDFFRILRAPLKALREGDTLVVWALDRLGGSLGQVITLLDDLKKRGITFIAIKDRIDTNAPVIGEIYTHLMAIFSSFERNRNIERTRSGLAAARARGRVGGRKPSLSEEDVKQIRILLADPEMTVGAVAKRFNVSRMTIYRYTTKS